MHLTPLDKLELALSLAHQSLPQALACDLLNGAVRLNEIHHEPAYTTYNPGAIFRHAFDDAPFRCEVNVEPVTAAVGDVFLVGALTLLLAQYAQLDQDTTLIVEVFQQPDKTLTEGVPCVALSFDGFGSFPSTYPVGDTDVMTISFDELQSLWTLATRGGRIDKAPNGLLLRLTGVRTLPKPNLIPDPVREAVEQAADACDTDPDSARAPLDDALAIIDGPAGPELADLKTLVHEIARDCQPDLDIHGVVFEPLFGADLPPIPIRRAQIRGMFKRILACAADADSPGAAVSILFEYDAARRAVAFVASITGVQTVPAHAAMMASIRRTVVDTHAGTFESRAEKSEVTLTISLPDTVGRKIDAGIPGFDSFSDQSRKILRLLYSGAPTPPPELLLQGILEEELARWLLPQLETPAAVNVAHALAQDPKLKPLASPDRLKKALEQIQKGKPKRDISRPPFAAEIIHAYSPTPRSRSALNANNLTEADMEELAKALISRSTPETLQLCLQLLAKQQIGVARTR